MKKLLCALLLLALLIPLVAAAEEKPSILGDFETTDIFGEAVDSGIISGAELTFVNVWATYCDPCIKEMPIFVELADEYEGRVQFLGIACDINVGNGANESTQELAVEIVEQLGATNYKHIVPTDYLNNRILFSINYVPTSFCVDSEGRQVGKAHGYFSSKDELKAFIDDALAQLKA